MLYKIFCIKIAVDLVGPQLASASMKHSLWLLYFLSIHILLLTLLIILLMPKTLDLLSPPAKRIDSILSRLDAYRRFLAKREIGVSLTIILIVQ